MNKLLSFFSVLFALLALSSTSTAKVVVPDLHYSVASPDYVVVNSSITYVDYMICFLCENRQVHCNSSLTFRANSIQRNNIFRDNRYGLRSQDIFIWVNSTGTIPYLSKYNSRQGNPRGFYYRYSSQHRKL